MFSANFTQNVGQTEITTIVTIGKFGVIKTKQCENGRVQIMNVNWFINCRRTKLIRRPINGAAPDPATSQPRAKTFVVVITARNIIAVAVLGWLAAEFTTPDNKGASVQQTALFQVRQKAPTGWSISNALLASLSFISL